MQKLLQTDIIREPKTLYFCKGNPIAIYKAKPGRRKRDDETEMKAMEQEYAEQQ